MKTKLIRQNHKTPNFVHMYSMLDALKALLDADVEPDNKNWISDFEEVLAFQEKDGSFNLLDSFKVESDARVDFCYMPTYLCTAIIMKSFMTNSALLSGHEDALQKALRKCCGRKLAGHGYEASSGRIEAIKVFMKAGLREFLLYHNDLCPEFTEMIESVRFYGVKDDEVNRYLNRQYVFVYGTLLKGERNHSLIGESRLVDTATVSGYSMYDIGSFPAIVPGKEIITGEIYEIDSDTLENLDLLEGEGELYKRKCAPVQLNSGKAVFAHVYEYLHDIDGLDHIPEYAQPYTAGWKEELSNYVWYVSYGSNMCYERFMCYIKGGSYKGCRPLEPCKDTSKPLAVKPYILPYSMYFANYSAQWDGGVSFLDVTKSGKAYGVAYLITREQYEHVARQENGGQNPELGGWYNLSKSLGIYEGVEVVTVTSKYIHEYNK